MNWSAALVQVGGKPGLGPNQGKPPVAFLDELLALIAPLPDILFSPTPGHDIYSLIRPVLGPLGNVPWTDLRERKAAMALVLVIDGGYESTWHWEKGADASAGQETIEEEETGLWQVSADSMGLAPSLRGFIVEQLGTDHPRVFIEAMKSDHALAVEYVIRLFRARTDWSGPANENWLTRNVTRPAMAEWVTAFAQ